MCNLLVLCTFNVHAGRTCVIKWRLKFLIERIISHSKKKNVLTDEEDIQTIINNLVKTWNYVFVKMIQENHILFLVVLNKVMALYQLPKHRKWMILREMMKTQRKTGSEDSLKTFSDTEPNCDIDTQFIEGSTIA